MFDNSRARHYSAYRGVICLIIVGQGTTLLTEASYVLIIVGQGPTLLTGVGEVGVDFFSHLCHYSFPSSALWGTARY